MRTAYTSNLDVVPPSLDPGGNELEQELSLLQKRDSWLSRYSVFVSVLLVAAIVTLAAMAVHQGVGTFLKIRLTEAIFALIGLIVLFNVYTIRQEFLIKQLRAELADKQAQFYGLRNSSMLDPLTGLYNRRFAEQRLAAEVARTQRMGHPLALVLLDLKNFGLINERLGRDAGDQALREFGARMSSVIRGSDLAVRLDADKFMMILPECATEQLNRVLSRLAPFELHWKGHEVPLTFASSCKQYQIGESSDEFVARAEQTLVSAKRGGAKAPHFETIAL
ncbi:MAG TPA: GGDEF domain-containing protein [Candidatus Acidoferrum sp.]|nr:GGDEF domain-containing protein [Candidatus Acidoferrum sp.]